MTIPDVLVQRTDEARSFVTRRIAGETLIVPVTGHVMNLESIYVVNDVGARIWELLDAPVGVDRIADVLAAEFAVSIERAREDAAEFIASLTERGLVHTTGARH